MKLLGKIWRIGWRLAVCVLLLGWIFQSIFWNEGQAAWLRDKHQPVWEQLSRWQRLEVSWNHGPLELGHKLWLVDSGMLALSFGLMGATLVLGMLRWRAVLRVHGLNLSVGRATEISLVAHFFNSFLLGSTGGDLMKAYYAARETHHKKTEAVTTVFVDRLIGLFSMLLFASVFMLPNWGLLVEHEHLAAVAWVVLAMLAGCSGLVFLAFWGGITRSVPGARIWLRKLPKGATLEQSLDACRVFGRHPGFLLQSLGLSMLLNLVCVLQLMALAHGLGLAIPARVLLLVVPSIICISALPITPSGLGVRENLFVLMLAAPELAVPHTTALSLSLLAYAGSLFWSLVGGGVYLACRGRHHLAEVAHPGAAGPPAPNQPE